MLVIPSILTAVGTQDVLSHLILYGQPMGIHPLPHQQGDSCTRINHHEALSSLAPGLVTPCNLPGSNADGDVWLMSLLLLGFGRFRPQLGRLEPTRRHMYLLDDQGIGHLKQDTR